LNVHGVNYVWQTEIHVAEPLLSEPSSLEVGITIAKLKRCKSSGIDQIPSDLIEIVGSTLRSQIHKLGNSLWNKEELSQQWKDSIIVPIYKKGDKTDCSNYRGMSLLPATYKILFNIRASKLTPK
jgi:hypothetical protein